MTKPRTGDDQDTPDILSEHGDDALEQGLPDLRQEPGPELHQQVQATPHQEQRSAGSLRRGWRPFIRAGALGSAVILTTLLLLLVSPQARQVAAQVLDGLERAFTSISGNTHGLTGLQPPPTFTAKQPGYLPAGFELYGRRYTINPGPDIETGESVTSETQIIDSNNPDPVIQAALERDYGSIVHLVLAYKSADEEHLPLFERIVQLVQPYKSADEEYLLLFQRVAQPDEALPNGEPRMVGDLPAVLQQQGEMPKLTWIDDGTWIELASNLPETELIKVAERLVPLPVLDQMDHLRRAPFCDPAHEASQNITMGRVEGQQKLGTISIELLDGEEHPKSAFDREKYPESMASSWNVPDKRPVIEAAIAALRDPATPMQQLPYPSLSFFSDGPDGCLEPDAAVEGYVVIEVWEQQVKIGYGGSGVEQKERVIKVLERVMQE